MPTNTKQQLCIKPTGFLVNLFAFIFRDSQSTSKIDTSEHLASNLGNLQSNKNKSTKTTVSNTDTNTDKTTRNDFNAANTQYETS